MISKRYDLCVGTSYGKCDTRELLQLKDSKGNAVLHGGVVRIKVDLKHNKTYYTTIKAYNQGHKIYVCNATSDGVRVDSTKPLKVRTRRPFNSTPVGRLIPPRCGQSDFARPSARTPHGKARTRVGGLAKSRKPTHANVFTALAT